MWPQLVLVMVLTYLSLGGCMVILCWEQIRFHARSRFVFRWAVLIMILFWLFLMLDVDDQEG